MNRNGLYGRLGLAIALVAGFVLLSSKPTPWAYVILAALAIAGLMLFVVSPNGENGDEA